MAEQYNLKGIPEGTKGVLIGNWVEEMALRETGDASKCGRVIGGSYKEKTNSTTHDEYPTYKSLDTDITFTYRRKTRDEAQILKDSISEFYAFKKEKEQKEEQRNLSYMFGGLDQPEKPKPTPCPPIAGNEPAITVYSEYRKSGQFLEGMTPVGSHIASGRNTIRSQPIGEYMRGKEAYQ